MIPWDVEQRGEFTTVDTHLSEVGSDGSGVCYFFLRCRVPINNQKVVNLKQELNKRGIPLFTT